MRISINLKRFLTQKFWNQLDLAWEDYINFLHKHALTTLAQERTSSSMMSFTAAAAAMDTVAAQEDTPAMLRRSTLLYDLQRAESLMHGHLFHAIVYMQYQPMEKNIFNFLFGEEQTDEIGNWLQDEAICAEVKIPNHLVDTMLFHWPVLQGAIDEAAQCHNESLTWGVALGPLRQARYLIDVAPWRSNDPRDKKMVFRTLSDPAVQKYTISVEHKKLICRIRNQADESFGHSLDALRRCGIILPPQNMDGVEENQQYDSESDSEDDMYGLTPSPASVLQIQAGQRQYGRDLTRWPGGFLPPALDPATYPSGVLPDHFAWPVEGPLTEQDTREVTALGQANGARPAVSPGKARYMEACERAGLRREHFDEFQEWQKQNQRDNVAAFLQQQSVEHLYPQVDVSGTPVAQEEPSSSSTGIEGTLLGGQVRPQPQEESPLDQDMSDIDPDDL